MLRPIDTQIIYQQSQEVSNRQQMANQETEMQQMQFSNILHKETALKQESVGEVKQEELIKNSLKDKKGRQQSKEQGKYKKKTEKDTEEETSGDAHHIDIRV